MRQVRSNVVWLMPNALRSLTGDDVRNLVPRSNAGGAVAVEDLLQIGE